MKYAPFAFSLLLVGAGCFQSTAGIDSFAECAAAGYPIMESYPRQCRAGGKTYVEVIAVPPSPPPSEEQSDTVTLQKSQSATLSGGLKVTLTDINDSRCKKDVVCVWAGELAAVLSVELEGKESPAVELTLGETTKPSGSAYGRTFTLKAITETSATISVSQ